MMRIDVAQGLGRLRAAAATGGPRERYLAACAALQFWSDLDLCVVAKTEAVAAQCTDARRAVEHAAGAWLGRTAAMLALDERPTPVEVVLAVDPGTPLLDKVLHLPLPEFCGYNLADLELAVADAAWFAERVGAARRAVLIVGIRTGGAYLAPLWWHALCDLGVSDVEWCSVRPAGGTVSCSGMAAARRWLAAAAAPVVVVLDDQPDTGATLEGAAQPLRAPGVEIWFGSVGKLWRDTGGRRQPERIQAPALVRRSEPRLWQCLLPAEQARFLARLAGSASMPALPTDAILKWRCPHGEACYGQGQPWRPWNHADVVGGRRPLVNPRKTPLTVCKRDGEPLLHLRFIGTDVFGVAEFKRIQGLPRAPRAWFVDGYRISADLGPTQPLRQRFHVADAAGRTDLLAQCADWIEALTREPVAQVVAGHETLYLRPRWATLALAAYERQCPLPDVAAGLRDFLEGPVIRFGRQGKAIRSSLRYACGYWHWQVDGDGRVQRFQLEANWGDVSWPELELAACALANRLDAASVVCLAARCGARHRDVIEALPLAALMSAEAMLRSVRSPSRDGRIAMAADFRELFACTCTLAGIATASGGCNG